MLAAPPLDVDCRVRRLHRQASAAARDVGDSAAITTIGLRKRNGRTRKPEVVDRDSVWDAERGQRARDPRRRTGEVMHMNERDATLGHDPPQGITPPLAPGSREDRDGGSADLDAVADYPGDDMTPCPVRGCQSARVSLGSAPPIVDKMQDAGTHADRMRSHAQRIRSHGSASHQRADCR